MHVEILASTERDNGRVGRLAEWFEKKGIKVWSELDLPAPEGLTPYDLSREIGVLLEEKGKEDLYLELMEAVEWAKVEFAGHEGGRRLWRKSGDHVMTHPLWMVRFLLEIGVTDRDVILAIVLHDVPEDTDVTVGDVERRYGKGVAGLVDPVTKLKSSRMTAEQLGVEKEELDYDLGLPLPEEAAQWGTLDKLYGVKDPRAWLVKIADSLHNSLTLGSLRPRRKREEKARIARTYYAPLARALGLGAVADLIETGTVVALHTGRSRKISEKLVEVEAMFGERIPEALMRWEKLGVGFVQSKWRMPNIAVVFDRTLGEEEVTVKACLPELYLDFESVDERWLGYAKLARILGVCKQDREVDHDPLESNIEDDLGWLWKGWSVRQGGAEYVLPIHMRVGGSQFKLLRAMDDEPVDPKWEASIGERLRAMKHEYRRRARKNIEFSIRQAVELNTRGRIEVFGQDGASRQIVKGATTLDFAHDVHEMLGLRAITARVMRGEQVLWGLGEVLHAGDGVVVMTGVGGSIEGETRGGVSLDDLDRVVTVKAQEEIRRHLERRGYFETAEGMRAVDLRGNRILMWLFEVKYGQRMWASQLWGFSGDLVSSYGDFGRFRQRVGRIQRPSGRDEFVKYWVGEGRVTSPLLRDVETLLENIDEFQRTRYGVEMSISDEVGVLAALGAFLEESGASAQNFDTWADNEAIGDSYSNLSFCLQEGGVVEAERVVRLLFEYFGDKLRQARVVEPDSESE